jgi:hypothetical protein
MGPCLEATFSWLRCIGLPFYPNFHSSGKAIGSLFLCLNEARTIDTEERQIAELSAKLAAIVIGKASRRRELQQSKIEIEEELTDARLLQKLSMELIQEEDTPGLYQKIMDAAVVIMQSQYASMQVRIYVGNYQPTHLFRGRNFGCSKYAALFKKWKVAGYDLHPLGSYAFTD